MKKWRIHYLQHVDFEDPGCIATWANDNDYPLTVTRFYNNESLPSQDEFDWLIVMGGPMSIHDEAVYDWLAPEKEFIKATIQAGKKVLGICLGAQLIADAMGAEVLPAEEKEIGWFNLSFSQTALKHPLFNNFPSSTPVFHWHGETFTLPENALRIASSEACLNQGFIVNDCVVGLQFHLEVTEESMQQMVLHGKEELTKSSFVQAEDEILTSTEYIAQNNALMFQLLNQLAL